MQPQQRKADEPPAEKHKTPKKGKCQHTKKIHQRHYNKRQNSFFFIRFSEDQLSSTRRWEMGLRWTFLLALRSLSSSLSLVLTPFSHSYQTNLCFAISWSYHLASAGHTGETLQNGAEIWRNPLTDAALLPRPPKWFSSLTPPMNSHSFSLSAHVLLNHRHFPGPDFSILQPSLTMHGPSLMSRQRDLHEVSTVIPCDTFSPGSMK